MRRAHSNIGEKTAYRMGITDGENAEAGAAPNVPSGLTGLAPENYLFGYHVGQRRTYGKFHEQRLVQKELFQC